MVGLAVTNIHDSRFSADRGTKWSAVAASRSFHAPSQ